MSGNITEFLLSPDGGRSWKHLLKDGPPERAAPGRAHEQGAFKQAMEKGAPQLLEPIMSVEVQVPVEFQGAAIGMITAGLMSLAFMGFTGLIKL